MKVKSFRILDYKSIVDSGECRFSNDFAVLIGKNESGKTAILEALRDFDREQAISSQAVPLSAIDERPAIEVTFHIDPHELDTAAAQVPVNIPHEVRSRILADGICLVKTEPNQYDLKEDYLKALFNNISVPVAAGQEQPQPQNDEEFFREARAKKQKLDELMQGYTIPELKFSREPEVMQASLKNLKTFIKSRLAFMEQEAQKIEVVELLHSITHAINPAATGTGGVEVSPQTPKGVFIQAILKQMPRFVFFSDFTDILPFEIGMDSLSRNPIVVDFAHIVGLNLESFAKNDDMQRRMNILNRCSAIISGDFMGHWKQNKLELIARPAGNKLVFGVKESDGMDFYKVEQRSKGFQWFLSFYLRLNRYKNEAAVILIDEPGMNLHPVAQKEILKTLIDRANEGSQLMISTHSSLLIDPVRLDRLRFVSKTKEKGTLIKEGLDAVDHETLMPVLSAMRSQLPLDFPFIRPTASELTERIAEAATAAVAAHAAAHEAPVLQAALAKEEAKAAAAAEAAQLKEEPKIEIAAEKKEAEPKSFEIEIDEAEDAPQRRSFFGLFRRR